MKRFAPLMFAAVVLAISAVSAFGQSAILQGGSWVPGHLGAYSGTNSQPILIDSGSAQGGGVGTGVGELGITARGTGNPPYIGQGSGAYGSTFCMYDGPITSAAGYHSLCFSPNATGNVGLISYGANGGASSLPLNWNINGTSIVPVTCSGSPTSSFAVINGIVTHC